MLKFFIAVTTDPRLLQPGLITFLIKMLAWIQIFRKRVRICLPLFPFFPFTRLPAINASSISEYRHAWIAPRIRGGKQMGIWSWCRVHLLPTELDARDKRKSIDVEWATLFVCALHTSRNFRLYATHHDQFPPTTSDSSLDTPLFKARSWAEVALQLFLHLHVHTPQRKFFIQHGTWT